MIIHRPGGHQPSTSLSHQSQYPLQFRTLKNEVNKIGERNLKLKEDIYEAKRRLNSRTKSNQDIRLEKKQRVQQHPTPYINHHMRIVQDPEQTVRHNHARIHLPASSLQKISITQPIQQPQLVLIPQLVLQPQLVQQPTQIVHHQMPSGEKISQEQEYLNLRRICDLLTDQNTQLKKIIEVYQQSELQNMANFDKQVKELGSAIEEKNSKILTLEQQYQMLKSAKRSTNLYEEHYKPSQNNIHKDSYCESCQRLEAKIKELEHSLYMQGVDQHQAVEKIKFEAQTKINQILSNAANQSILSDHLHKLQTKMAIVNEEIRTKDKENLDLVTKLAQKNSLEQKLYERERQNSAFFEEISSLKCQNKKLYQNSTQFEQQSENKKHLEQEIQRINLFYKKQLQNYDNINKNLSSELLKRLEVSQKASKQLESKLSSEKQQLFGQNQSLRGELQRLSTILRESNETNNSSKEHEIYQEQFRQMEQFYKNQQQQLEQHCNNIVYNLEQQLTQTESESNKKQISYQHQLQELQSQSRNLIQKIHEAESKYTDVLEHYENQISKYELVLKEKDKDINDLEVIINEKENVNKRIMDQYSEIIEKVEQLEDEYRNLQRKNQEQERQIVIMTHNIQKSHTITDHNQTAHNSTANRKRQVNRYEGQCENLQEGQFKSSFEEQNNNRKNINYQLDFTKELSEQKHAIEMLTREINTLKESMKLTEHENMRYLQALSELNKEMENKQLRHSQIARKLEETEETMENVLKVELITVRYEKDKIQEDKSKLEDKIKELIEYYEEKIYTLENQKKSNQQEELKKIGRYVADSYDLSLEKTEKQEDFKKNTLKIDEINQELQKSMKRSRILTDNLQQITKENIASQKQILNLNHALEITNHKVFALQQQNLQLQQNINEISLIREKNENKNKIIKLDHEIEEEQLSAIFYKNKLEEAEDYIIVILKDVENYQRTIQNLENNLTLQEKNFVIESQTQRENIVHSFNQTQQKIIKEQNEKFLAEHKQMLNEKVERQKLVVALQEKLQKQQRFNHQKAIEIEILLNEKENNKHLFEQIQSQRGRREKELQEKDYKIQKLEEIINIQEKQKYIKENNTTINIEQINQFQFIKNKLEEAEDYIVFIRKENQQLKSIQVQKTNLIQQLQVSQLEIVTKDRQISNLQQEIKAKSESIHYLTQEKHSSPQHLQNKLKSYEEKLFNQQKQYQKAMSQVNNVYLSTKIEKQHLLQKNLDEKNQIEKKWNQILEIERKRFLIDTQRFIREIHEKDTKIEQLQNNIKNLKDTENNKENQNTIFFKQKLFEAESYINEIQKGNENNLKIILDHQENIQKLKNQIQMLGTYERVNQTKEEQNKIFTKDFEEAKNLILKLESIIKEEEIRKRILQSEVNEVRKQKLKIERQLYEIIKKQEEELALIVSNSNETGTLDKKLEEQKKFRILARKESDIKIVPEDYFDSIAKKESEIRRISKKHSLLLEENEKLDRQLTIFKDSLKLAEAREFYMEKKLYYSERNALKIPEDALQRAKYFETKLDEAESYIKDVEPELKRLEALNAQLITKFLMLEETLMKMHERQSQNNKENQEEIIRSSTFKHYYESENQIYKVRLAEAQQIINDLEEESFQLKLTIKSASMLESETKVINIARKDDIEAHISQEGIEFFQKKLSEAERYIAEIETRHQQVLLINQQLQWETQKLQGKISNKDQNIHNLQSISRENIQLQRKLHQKQLSFAEQNHQISILVENTKTLSKQKIHLERNLSELTLLLQASEKQKNIISLSNIQYQRKSKELEQKIKQIENHFQQERKSFSAQKQNSLISIKNDQTQIQSLTKELNILRINQQQNILTINNLRQQVLELKHEPDHQTISQGLTQKIKVIEQENVNLTKYIEQLQNNNKKSFQHINRDLLAESQHLKEIEELSQHLLVQNQGLKAKISQHQEEIGKAKYDRENYQQFKQSYQQIYSQKSGIEKKNLELINNLKENNDIFEKERQSAREINFSLQNAIKSLEDDKKAIKAEIQAMAAQNISKLQQQIQHNTKVKEESQFLKNKLLEAEKYIVQLTHANQKETENHNVTDSGEENSEFFRQKLYEAEDYIKQIQSHNQQLTNANQDLIYQVEKLSSNIQQLSDKIVVLETHSNKQERKVHQNQEIYQEEKDQQESQVKALRDLQILAKQKEVIVQSNIKLLQKVQEINKVILEREQKVSHEKQANNFLKKEMSLKERVLDEVRAENDRLSKSGLRYQGEIVRLNDLMKKAISDEEQLRDKLCQEKEGKLLQSQEINELRDTITRQEIALQQLIPENQLLIKSINQERDNARHLHTKLAAKQSYLQELQQEKETYTHQIHQNDKLVHNLTLANRDAEKNVEEADKKLKQIISVHEEQVRSIEQSFISEIINKDSEIMSLTNNQEQQVNLLKNENKRISAELQKKIQQIQESRVIDERNKEKIDSLEKQFAKLKKQIKQLESEKIEHEEQMNRYQQKLTEISSKLEFLEGKEDDEDNQNSIGKNQLTDSFEDASFLKKKLYEAEQYIAEITQSRQSELNIQRQFIKNQQQNKQTIQDLSNSIQQSIFTEERSKNVIEGLQNQIRRLNRSLEQNQQIINNLSTQIVDSKIKEEENTKVIEHLLSEIKYLNKKQEEDKIMLQNLANNRQNLLNDNEQEHKVTIINLTNEIQYYKISLEQRQKAGAVLEQENLKIKEEKEQLYSNYVEIEVQNDSNLQIISKLQAQLQALSNRCTQYQQLNILLEKANHQLKITNHQKDDGQLRYQQMTHKIANLSHQLSQQKDKTQKLENHLKQKQKEIEEKIEESLSYELKATENQNQILILNNIIQNKEQSNHENDVLIQEKTDEVEKIAEEAIGYQIMAKSNQNQIAVLNQIISHHQQERSSHEEQIQDYQAEILQKNHIIAEQDKIITAIQQELKSEQHHRQQLQLLQNQNSSLYQNLLLQQSHYQKLTEEKQKLELKSQEKDQLMKILQNNLSFNQKSIQKLNDSLNNQNTNQQLLEEDVKERVEAMKEEIDILKAKIQFYENNQEESRIQNQKLRGHLEAAKKEQYENESSRIDQLNEIVARLENKLQQQEAKTSAYENIVNSVRPNKMSEMEEKCEEVQEQKSVESNTSSLGERIKSTMKQLITITNNYQNIGNDPLYEPSLEDPQFPYLSELVNSLLYRFRLSSAIQLEKSLKIQQLNLQIEQYREEVANHSIDRNQYDQLLETVVEYQALNGELKDKLETMEEDVKKQSTTIREYEKILNNSINLSDKSIEKHDSAISHDYHQLRQKLENSEREIVKIKTGCDTPTDHYQFNNILTNRNQVQLQFYKEFLTHCLSEISQVQEKVQEVQEDLYRISQGKYEKEDVLNEMRLKGRKITQKQELQDSEQRSLLQSNKIMDKLQELEQKLLLNNSKLKQHQQVEEGQLFDLLRDVLDNNTNNIEEVNRIKIEEYLQQLEYQIIKNQAKHEEEMQKLEGMLHKYSREDVEDQHFLPKDQPLPNHQQAKIKFSNSHQNQPNQRSRTSGVQNNQIVSILKDRMIEEIKGLEQKIEIYHQQSTRRKKAYARTIEVLLKDIDDIKHQYENATFNKRDEKDLIEGNIEQNQVNEEKDYSDALKDKIDILAIKVRDAYEKNQIDSIDFNQRDYSDKVVTGNKTHMLSQNNTSLVVQIGHRSRSSQEIGIQNDANSQPFLQFLLNSNDIEKGALLLLKKKIAEMKSKEVRDNLSYLKGRQNKIEEVLGKTQNPNIQNIMIALANNCSKDEISQIFGSSDDNDQILARLTEALNLDIDSSFYKNQQTELLIQDIEDIKKKYYVHATKLSEIVYQHLIRLLSDKRNEQFSQHVHSLFQNCYSFEEENLELLKNKDQLLKHHSQRMNQIFNRSSSDNSEEYSNLVEDHQEARKISMQSEKKVKKSDSEEDEKQ